MRVARVFVGFVAGRGAALSDGPSQGFQLEPAAQPHGHCFGTQSVHMHTP